MYKILLICIVLVTAVQGWSSLLNTEFHRCAECVCHSRTGCFNRITCANYHIRRDMWDRAGKPTVGPNDDKYASNAYDICVKDENCVLNIIKEYTESFDKKRNCDLEMDCRDRLALFLFGQHYERSSYTDANRNRYNSCAKRKGYPELERHMRHLDVCVQVVDIPAV